MIANRSQIDPDPIRPDDRFIPTDMPYRILSASGRVLGDAYSLNEALDNFNRWEQSHAIVIGNYVVHQRKVNKPR